MKKWVFAALALVLAYGAPSFSLAQDQQKDKAVKEESQLSAADRAKQEKDILIANINGLRNQELRVTILQQIVNEEIGKLRNLEAVFADHYKLDVEKFRKGLYRYDDKLGKIIEEPASAKKK